MTMSVTSRLKLKRRQQLDRQLRTTRRPLTSKLNFVRNFLQSLAPKFWLNEDIAAALDI